eukprot:12245666-Prorocentrum_lima.AAC.1
MGGVTCRANEGPPAPLENPWSVKIWPIVLGASPSPPPTRQAVNASNSLEHADPRHINRKNQDVPTGRH